ncbi:MAG: helicase-related protein [Saprospiraceae bacterium]
MTEVTKFFTNEGENTLLNKIRSIFEHRQIHFFDALVGFFRASGYYMVREYVQKAKSIRILVGIDVGLLEGMYAAQGLEAMFKSDDIREDFLKQAFHDIQQAKYEKRVEEGIKAFLLDIVNQKIEIRAHPSQRIHAKIYIFREAVKHKNGYGFVITGSSNLTEPGLQGNFEFNVELREDVDVDFAEATFEKLWKEGIPIQPQIAEELTRKTFLNDAFTPYELYLKFLAEFFGEAIDYDSEDPFDLPEGFKRLTYQMEAVNDGFKKLREHNGFFLSDVVGLGKTVIAVMIAKKFYLANGSHTNTLIITPPAIKKSWEETVDKFRLRNIKIETNGSLHKITNPEKYDLVIVDEAHKFRSDTAIGFDLLQRICKEPPRQKGHIIHEENLNERRKRVILVSATPLNNRPEDLRNQIYLFMDPKDTTLETVPNLQRFFAPIIDEYKLLKRISDLNVVKEKVQELYEQVRNNVVEPLTVRRTRKDIETNEPYRKDALAQGIHFPTVEPPRNIYYPLDTALEQLYDETLNLLSTHITYARYQAIANLENSEHKDIFAQAELISQQLAKIMKTLLLKRLDSSFEAFKSTLRHFRDANAAMIRMFQNDKVYIVPKLRGKVSQYILDDNEEELEKVVFGLMEKSEKVLICKAGDFNADFLPKLEADQLVLEELVAKWSAIDQDPKWDEFLRHLKTTLLDKKINPEQKLVVFSEAAVTTNYLHKKLESHPEFKVLIVSADTRQNLEPVIKANFDANAKHEEKRNDFNLIIATDVLAEGINLHRANIIVNYDTPWNSTKLMQRIGRVNRIGSSAPKVYIYNFHPTAKVDNDIELKKRAFIKLQSFHAALGEDNPVYSDMEEVQTFGLFRPEAEERDRRIEFLMELRKFRTENPEWFKQIKDMPKRARTGRRNARLSGSTLAYIRSGRRHSFFLAKGPAEFKALTFLEAADLFKAFADEKSIPLHSRHHEHVEMAARMHREEGESIAVNIQAIDTSGSPAEKRVMRHLRALLPLPVVNDAEREELRRGIELVHLGKYANLVRTLDRYQKANVPKKGEKPKKSAVALLSDTLDIIRQYAKPTNGEDIPQKQEHSTRKTAQKPEIILSESFDA